MAFKHPKPLSNFDYIGFHHYLLTWCCSERKQVFTQRDCVDLVLQQIMRATRETDFEVVAYCFMPDHVHLLAKGASQVADGKRFFRLAKQYSGYYFSQTYEEKLWQRYGRDEVLWEDHGPWAAAQYIIENPVRAGIVTKPEDYPFTGSPTLTMQELIAWVNNRYR
ncbi:MAG: hypothetical protein RLZZ53_2246 [Acidobacteriota bacterium]|jgi:putative transposase